CYSHTEDGEFNEESHQKVSARRRSGIRGAVGIGYRRIGWSLSGTPKWVRWLCAKGWWQQPCLYLRRSRRLRLPPSSPQVPDGTRRNTRLVLHRMGGTSGTIAYSPTTGSYLSNSECGIVSDNGTGYESTSC